MGTNHGGKRKGAGRKPSLDKKLKVDLYIETSIINDLGGIENVKQLLYNFAKIEAGGKIIKTVNDAVQPIKGSDKCNMHFVSNSVCANIECPLRPIIGKCDLSESCNSFKQTDC